MMNPLTNFSNPFLQNMPFIPKSDENPEKTPIANTGAFPTVMVPGIGPCMMIPTAMAQGKHTNNLIPY